jgi:sec-independent protein translocase protein TatC
MFGKQKKKTEEDSKRTDQDLTTMPLLQHFEELRRRLFLIVVGILAGFVICLTYSKQIYNFLALPVLEVLKDQKLVFTKIQSPFIVYMKVALLAGFFLMIPWTLYQVWKFIAPALYKKERRLVFPFVFFATISFLAGAAFGYYILLPYAFNYLISIGSDFQPMLTVDDYFSLVSRLLLALGLIFQLPILIYFFAKMGIMTHRFLIKNIHWAVLLSAILGAILTPPDVISQFIVAMPLLLLYCFGILIAWLVTIRREQSEKKKKEE